MVETFEKAGYTICADGTILGKRSNQPLKPNYRQIGRQWP
jgi:hypothetical protein